MKVLITGSQGFIGKNLKISLERKAGIEIYEFNKNDKIEDLEKVIDLIDFIYHLAGENRPVNTEDFYSVNSGLTNQIIKIIESRGLKIPIVFTSSTQAELNNDYGKSKVEAEKIIEKYSLDNLISVYIYRLHNVFGKWSQPNYNTVIATWCFNIANDKEIIVNDPLKKLSLVYIDDIVSSFLLHLTEDKIRHFKDFYIINPVYEYTLGQISEYLYSFKNSRDSLIVHNVGDGFVRALYSTYLSFIPRNKLSYTIDSHKDDRGSFLEIIKTLKSGQFSISTSKPGVTRGNHYHDTKNEKFLVIKGSAKIQFRHILEEKVFEYDVSDDKYQVLDIPPGYTHNISNTGDEEMILLVWANESFDRDKPDTYYEEVKCEN